MITRKATIAEALNARLGRIATHAELCAEVRRILHGPLAHGRSEACSMPRAPSVLCVKCGCSPRTYCGMICDCVGHV